MRLAPLCLALVIALPAVAQVQPGWLVASELGKVIGSEKACGLSYDKAAIDAYVRKTVDPSDMSFAPSLGMMVRAAEGQSEKMGQSELAAHCAAVSQNAKHYGFTK